MVTRGNQMKKSIIALAILGTIGGSAQAQSAVTIYGILDTGIAYENKAATPAGSASKTGSKLQLSAGSVTGPRIGFKGSEDLGGGLRAIFQLEAGFAVDTGALTLQDRTGTQLFRRQSLVGLAGDFGTVKLGRQTDFMFDTCRWNACGSFGALVGSVGHYMNRTEGALTINSIRYDTVNLAGFTASAIYGFGETAGSNSSGQSLGLGGQYVNGPLALYTAYYQSKLGGTTAANVATGTPSDTTIEGSGGIFAPAFVGKPGQIALKVYSLGASYEVSSAVRVYGYFSSSGQPLASASTTNVVSGLSNRKANLYELGVNYFLTPTLRLQASVIHNRLNFAGVSSIGTLNEFNLGADYFLSKRTDVYAVVQNIRASNTNNPGIFDGTGSAGNQTAITTGVRHTF